MNYWDKLEPTDEKMSVGFNSLITIKEFKNRLIVNYLNYFLK